MNKINMLKERIDKEDNKLYKAIYKNIFNNLDDKEDDKELMDSLNDICNCSNISGYLEDFAYTEDVEKFFDKYSTEILERYNDIMDLYGKHPLDTDYVFNKSNLVNFTYKSIAYDLLTVLDLEILEL